MDRMIPDDLRRLVVGEARGKVLEVGVGTGKNLPLYPPGCDVTGIDFSPAMLARAKKRAAKLGVDVMLLEMDAERLSFPDDSFDTVLATCVFCSVPDPVNGLKEMRRVCKPDGLILLLEHVRSENRVLGLVMDLLNPLAVRLTGANINRRTVENVKAAGLSITEVQDVKGPIVKIIRAAKGRRSA